ncbi:MAG: AAA family ATPase [Desulfovibrionaceae bacterium]
MEHAPLSIEDILIEYTPLLFTWKSTKDLTQDHNSFLPQKRVYDAITMAINTKGNLYNALLTSTQEEDLEEIERFISTQINKPYVSIQDIILLNNFTNPSDIMAVLLPKGMGIRLEKSLYTVLHKIEREKNKLYKNKEISSKLDSLFKVRDLLNEEIKNIAKANDFNITIHNETNELNIYSINKKNNSEKEKITFIERVSKELKKLRQINESIKKEKNAPQRKELKDAIEKNISYMKKTYKDKDNTLKKYFEDMQDDLLNNQYFLESHDNINTTLHPIWMERYQINIFVNNDKQTTIPFVREQQPTFSNLLGYRKRDSSTEHSIGYNFAKQFVSGSLHQAIGGILLLNVSDLLRYPQSLKLFLEKIYAKDYSISFPNYPEEIYSFDSITTALKKCHLKTLLVAKEKQYTLLEETEEYFMNIFPIQGQFISSVKNTDENILTLLQYFLRIIERYELLHFTKEAIITLLRYGAKLVHNQCKISLDTQEYINILRESSTIAESYNSYIVCEEHVEESIKKKRFRNNLIEETFMEEYNTNLLHLKTSGETIGIINALGIIEYHEFTLGVVHKISCAVGRTSSPKENIINIEKAVNMTGEIHSKATLIIQSYLLQMFADNKGLSLQAYYYFEQAYSKVDGDSASCAQLIALLSALAEIPLSQEIAITGAISQYGEILAVGGVDTKIEGFFALCQSNGLTGKQGVIIPKDNILHLTLNKDVLDAIKNKQFSIYPTATIKEGIEILTKTKAGTKDKNGNFTKDSFFDKVNTRLKEFLII